MARVRRLPPTIAFAFVVLAVFVACAVLADLIAPHHYAEQNPLARFRPPSLTPYETGLHLFGTDQLGRDVFSRTVYAMRFSILIAIAGTLIGAVLGSVLGVMAAHFRGWLEDAIMGLVDVQASLPFMIFALFILALFGGNFAVFVLLMGIAGWERYARLVRGLVVDAATNGYALTIREFGAGIWRIYGRHIAPNILAPIIVQMTINFPETILLETGLSFLGLGVQPPLTSLGLMVAEGREQIFFAWWLIAVPGVMIFFATWSVSILGDWLRDELDVMLA